MKRTEFPRFEQNQRLNGDFPSLQRFFRSRGAVIPAQVGIPEPPRLYKRRLWIPAFAGMTTREHEAQTPKCQCFIHLSTPFTSIKLLNIFMNLENIVSSCAQRRQTSVAQRQSRHSRESGNDTASI
jgi:hypothetical protein